MEEHAEKMKKTKKRHAKVAGMKTRKTKPKSSKISMAPSGAANAGDISRGIQAGADNLGPGKGGFGLESREENGNFIFRSNMLEEISDVAYATDVNMRITSWNPAAEKAYGWKAEEVLGKPVLEVTGSKFDTETSDIMARALLEKGSVKAMLEHSSKSGRRLIFDSIIMSKRGPDDKLLGYISVNHDITELKNAQDDLLKAWDIAEARAREAEEGGRLLNTLFEHIPEGLVLSTKDGESIRISRCMREWIGCDTDEFTMTQWRELMPLYNYREGLRIKGEDLPIFRIMRTGETIHGEQYLLKPANRPERIITAEAGPVLDAGGKATGFVVAWRDMTEKIKVEEVLRKSMQRLKYHNTNSPLAVVEWDSDYIVTQWSTEAENIFGWKKEETLGVRIDKLNIIYPEDIPLVNRTMERLSGGKELTVVSTNRNITKSGGIIEAVWYNSVLLDEYGKMASVMSLVQDVTEQKRMERENAALLKETSERAAWLDAIIDSQATGIMIYDISGKAVRMNEPARKILPVDIFMNMNIEERLKVFRWETESGQQFSSDRIPVVRAIRGETVHNIMMAAVFPDRKAWILASAAPIITSEGKMLGAVASFADMTDRKKTEETLRDRENKLEVLTESILDIFTAIDRDLRFTYWNRTAEKISGISSEAAIGRTRLELFGDNEDSIKTTEYQRECINSGRPIRYENEMILDGIKRVFDIRIFPTKEGASIISRDITERKQAELVLKRDNETFYGLVREKTDELVASQMALEKAKRLSDIGSLAAVVAHELRNPLAAIGVVTYNIKRKSKEPYITKNLESIQKKIGESVQIINNLLYYSRLKPPHYQDVNIYDLLEESMGTLVDINEKKATIQKKYKRLAGVKIEADQTQIKEVFYNILNNAYDAVPQKDGKINITAKNTKRSVEICFLNNGSFIEKESLEKVFDPFFTTKAKGTGLGLTVCRQIINYHNGSITVESDAEHGTLFKIILPKKREVI